MIIVPSSQPGAEKGEEDSRQKTMPHSPEVPTAPYDRCQAQLFTVQKTVDTYLSDPKGMPSLLTLSAPH